MTRLRMFTGATFASLRVRNFRLFFIGQGISQIGTWLGMVAQTLLVLRLTDSGIALGLLAAAQFGPVLLLGAWAGVVADRSDKRTLLLGLQGLGMAQAFTMAGLAFMGSPPVAAVYGVALVAGVVTAFENPARRSFVVEMVPTEHVTNAVSLNSAVMTAARVVGPALAGAMVLTVGFGWTFVLDGLSYSAVLAGFLRMRRSELRPGPVLERAKGQVRAGLRYARSMPQLWAPLVMTTIIGTLAYNFQVVFPLFVTKDLGGTDTTFTMLYSTISFGSLVGALAVARRRSSSVRMVALAALAFGAGMALLALTPTATIAFVLAPAIGIASIAFMTQSTAIVQTEALPEMRGRVLALQSMVFLGTTPIGGPLVGWVAESFGARWALVLGAVGCAVAGGWGLRVASRIGPEREDRPVTRLSDRRRDGSREQDSPGAGSTVRRPAGTTVATG